LTEGKFKDIPTFKFDKEETPFSSEGKEIYALMKRKAPEEQIEPYIEAIQEQAAGHNLDPVLASTDVYVTAMCHNGAKSVSHITAAIDRSKDRLQKTRQQSSGVGRQIVQSVVIYWKDQPGNAVNIVDKLLNYTIVTPESVIEWALSPESLGNGAVLAQAWRYEIVSKTMTKVTTRVQQIVQAKVNLEVQAANAGAENPAVQQQIQQMDDLLNSERHAMRQLFSTIEDAVAGVASGAADGFVESSTGEEDAELVKAWGEKWARVFRRKLAVEEAHVGEAAVEAQLVSAKEQDKLAKERAARQAEEEAAARAKEEEERALMLAKEEAERAAANGDTAMDGVDINGSGEADLDVAE
jgi:nuclear cap-binding protein subunit 1